MTALHRRLLGLLDAARTNYFWDPTSTRGIVQQLERWADERPDDPYLLFEGRGWTIGAFEERAEAHAQRYLQLGIEAGDVVALALGNRPAHLFHLYGLLKLGAITALLNPALRGPALAHALQSANAKLLVCEGSRDASAAMVGAAGGLGLRCLADVEPPSEGDGQAHGDARPNRDDTLPCPRWSCASTARRLSRPPRPISETCAYVYTSGTTGLPKASVVKAHRLFRAGRIFGAFANAGRRDGLYLCLPLHHGNAMVIGVPLSLTHRCRLILARRFSARGFVADCRTHDGTLAMYIGELGRYLLASPELADDAESPLRLLLGNGLRPEHWRPLKERFGVERIIEYYAATEGNAETINMLGVEGSCGPLLPGKMALARYDVERGELIRDELGFCQRAPAGEAGLLLGAIGPRNEFEGYTSDEATSAKILQDVFRGGDAWFDTGDLLRRDHLLHLYFVDRLGDTFRWKGENVSTEEVAQRLCERPEVALCAVYGVQIPGQEGRCGMAALELQERANLDGEALYAALDETLPTYAQPRFLRLMEALPLTASLKPRKNELAQEGFDPRSISDPLWLRDPEARRYIPLDRELHDAVISGAFPL